MIFIQGVQSGGVYSCLSLLENTTKKTDLIPSYTLTLFMMWPLQADWYSEFNYMHVEIWLAHDSIIYERMIGNEWNGICNVWSESGCNEWNETECNVWLT